MENQKKIGRFEIHSELGRGAQSVVYLGSDPQLQRQVAIKTLHFARHSDQENKVLLSEARMVSKLCHPNIVPIFDAGEEGGDIYLVFEYVPARNLADFLRESGPLPPVKSISIMRKVLDAVAAAHAQGIIHRDLKPSNILLDMKGNPRVMDFGIAMAVEGAAPGNEGMTGTPSYMAPEYIGKRIIDARTDIFAAGLIHLEMLTGRRAVEGNNVFQIIHRLANEDIRLPQDINPPIDDALASILYKAIARDPQMRYQSASQYAEALDAYLEPQESNEKISAGKQSTLDFLLRRMRHKSDFPALSESISTINKIASSEKESISKLSNTILKDFALTNKILRLVNTAYFRPAGAGSISTVTSAVMVLGFEAVRNVAVSVLLFEHMQSKSNADNLKEEFLRANLAAVIARHIAGRFNLRDAEQVYICALFQNLGRLLIQYYFPEESDELRRLMESKHCSEEQAATQVFGITPENVGIAVAEQWGFPPLILNSIRKLPKGKVRRPMQTEDRLQALSCFSNDWCALIAAGARNTHSKEALALLTRFAECTQIGERELQDGSRRSIEEIGEFANIIHINLKQSAFGRQILQFKRGQTKSEEESEAEIIGSITILPGAMPEQLEEEGPSAVDAIAEAQAILSAGTQDISNALVDGYKLNDILHIVLETLFRALKFDRTVFCIKDARTNTMHGRFGFGAEGQALARKFQFAISDSADVFCVAANKGSDLLISNIDDPKIAKWIPDWYRKITPARTFMLLPLMIKGKPVAMIYADKNNPDEINLPEKLLTLLRTLRNQAVLAIKHGS